MPMPGLLPLTCSVLQCRQNTELMRGCGEALAYRCAVSPPATAQINGTFRPARQVSSSWARPNGMRKARAACVCAVALCWFVRLSVRPSVCRAAAWATSAGASVLRVLGWPMHICAAA